MWNKRRFWRDLMFPGSSKKRLNSGSKSSSRASFLGAKMVILCLVTASSSG
uniref:Uncharacterized protein n=1 Tax=Solanum lycopersicum TaxID=4081 RepID=A0A3Q7E8E8_SOLLC